MRYGMSHLLTRGLIALSPEGAPAVAPPAATPPVTPPVTPPAETPPVEPPVVPPVTPPVAPPAAPVPQKYELKLPENSTVDPTVLERTAAIARELGLSNDAAQKTTEFVASEVATQVAATLAAHAYQGAEWTKQREGYEKEALADPMLGANKPEQLAANVELAKRALAKYGDESSITFLEQSGLGSHPAALRLLVNIGKAMSEGSLVLPAGGSARTEEDKAKGLFPSMAK